ncbi:HlyD family secretion protein [Paludibacterium yongneupense]|uniref:HlyD family secretion protein n=1 Tax=Paludibacterium yongneupense TaxID=400061 RepID=UPI000408F10C|nr:efflux RND transporter periplasmic adaptor subunit [Paludibacterium yongneupense]
MRAIRLLGVVPLILVAGIGYGIWRSHQHGVPDGLIQVNGRIEGDHTFVASKYPGRLMELVPHEGDSVRAGTVVARLSSDELVSRQAGVRAALDAARARSQRARAVWVQAARDADRYQALLARGSVDRVHAEQMRLAAVSAESQFREAEAQIRQAAAGSDEVGSQLKEMTLLAPAAGMVTTRLHEPGDVLAAGGAVLDIVDLNRLYLKVYVPEDQIGKVRLGLPARIYTDAWPGLAFAARVSTIAGRAEFTPKEVQTPDERVKLVYAVKLAVAENPGWRLTPGVPADAVIRWNDTVAWQRPRW